MVEETTQRHVRKKRFYTGIEAVHELFSVVDTITSYWRPFCRLFVRSTTRCAKKS
jgi:hypothetical protein